MNSEETSFLVVGEIIKPWGNHGEVKIHVLTDFPRRLTKLKTVLLGPDARAVEVERARLHSGFASMKLAGYDTPEQAAKLRGQVVRIPIEQAAPLNKGQYYQHEIIGLSVSTAEGEALGRVEEILETGANDVYLIRRPGGGELLLPAIADVIQEIDLPNHRMIVNPIPGLLD